MSETVAINKYDETYLSIDCSPSVLQEISDYFSFETPNARFNPKVQRGYWDGKFRLVDKRKRQLYLGLKDDLIEFCNYNQYIISNHILGMKKFVQYYEFEAFTKTLNLPPDRVPFDYQIQACIDVINNHGRGILLSAVNSGKSLMLYLLSCWYKHKTLIIVPTTNLVLQMQSDFASYNYPDPVSIIMAGESKTNLNPVVASTWQSLIDMPAAFFNQFSSIFVDEAHGAEAKSIVDIMKKATKVSHRVGMTGTLDKGKTKTDVMVLTGLFGKIFTVIKTYELIKRGISSDIDITCVELNYPEDYRKEMRKKYNAYKEELRYAKRNKQKPPLMFYKQEIDYLVGDKTGIVDGFTKRQRFIAQLACKLEGNTLLLFRYVRHGKELAEQIQALTNKKVFIIYADIKAKEREEIRKTLEKEDDIIVVASYKTTSVGMNVKNLHNIIFSSPVKGMIVTLQSIGRVLRKHKDKVEAKFYDIGDNLCIGMYKNYAYQHFTQRMEYYVNEKFNFRIRKVEL